MVRLSFLSLVEIIPSMIEDICEFFYFLQNQIFFRFSSSVTLIIDEKMATNERCYILVDTGLPIFKNTLIGGLAAHGIRLQDIQTLILTHPDVDAMGNLNLFPYTDILTENKIINRQFVYIQKSVPLLVSFFDIIFN